MNVMLGTILGTILLFSGTPVSNRDRLIRLTPDNENQSPLKILSADLGPRGNGKYEFRLLVRNSGTIAICSFAVSIGVAMLGFDAEVNPSSEVAVRMPFSPDEFDRIKSMASTTKPLRQINVLELRWCRDAGTLVSVEIRPEIAEGLPLKVATEGRVLSFPVEPTTTLRTIEGDPVICYARSNLGLTNTSRQPIRRIKFRIYGAARTGWVELIGGSLETDLQPGHSRSTRLILPLAVDVKYAIVEFREFRFVVETVH